MRPNIYPEGDVAFDDGYNSLLSLAKVFRKVSRHHSDKGPSQLAPARWLEQSAHSKPGAKIEAGKMGAHDLLTSPARPQDCAWLLSTQGLVQEAGVLLGVC
jgi:hypothetical protein